MGGNKSEGDNTPKTPAKPVKLSDFAVELIKDIAYPDTTMDIFADLQMELTTNNRFIGIKMMELSATLSDPEAFRSMNMYRSDAQLEGLLIKSRERLEEAAKMVDLAAEVYKSLLTDLLDVADHGVLHPTETKPTPKTAEVVA